ncbi:hypothetical protein SAMN05421743_105241 [Thalassobacillus cyri]|uniref:Uncharacterized protein n=1 Tax=Thalassobacillus cyri TaxID=571932 RepID=A0A1H4C2H1_9BACI|nr:hypothetical protein SAMN05421743_105241 [Thalassobacillus cyri]
MSFITSNLSAMSDDKDVVIDTSSCTLGVRFEGGLTN